MMSFLMLSTHAQTTDGILRNKDTDRLDDQILVNLLFELGLHKMRNLPDLRIIMGELFDPVVPIPYQYQQKLIVDFEVAGRPSESIGGSSSFQAQLCSGSQNLYNLLSAVTWQRWIPVFHD